MPFQVAFSVVGIESLEAVWSQIQAKSTPGKFFCILTTPVFAEEASFTIDGFSRPLIVAKIEATSEFMSTTTTSYMQRFGYYMVMVMDMVAC